MSFNWSASTSVSQGSSKPGAPVTALPSGDSIVLFVADVNGQIFPPILKEK
jgi:hypothetical protein